MSTRTVSHRAEVGIICFSNLDWGFLRYRKQHLMERLATRMPVVYVNPPRATKWRRPDRWGQERRVSQSLSVHDPIVLPGIRNWSGARRINHALIARALSSHRSRLCPLIAWVYSPHALPFIERLTPELVVYDMADDYTVPSGAALRPGEREELQRLETLERAVLERADVVLCVSEPLVDKARACGRQAHLVPNGCDLAAAVSPAGPRPRGVRPRIGYVGSIAPRFDLNLVLEMAECHPSWDIDLVGPVSPLVHLPERRPDNIRWTGEIPYADVAAKIASFDVGILPLRDIPFAHRCSPIQVYDYLAAGKPVISSPVDQLAHMPDLVATARGAGQFGRSIEAALAFDTPARVEARVAFARRSSWDARVSQVVKILDVALQPRPLAVSA